MFVCTVRTKTPQSRTEGLRSDSNEAAHFSFGSGSRAPTEVRMDVRKGQRSLDAFVASVGSRATGTATDPSATGCVLSRRNSVGRGRHDSSPPVSFPRTCSAPVPGPSRAGNEHPPSRRSGRRTPPPILRRRCRATRRTTTSDPSPDERSRSRARATSTTPRPCPRARVPGPRCSASQPTRPPRRRRAARPPRPCAPFRRRCRIRPSPVVAARRRARPARPPRPAGAPAPRKRQTQRLLAERAEAASPAVPPGTRTEPPGRPRRPRHRRPPRPPEGLPRRQGRSGTG